MFVPIVAGVIVYLLVTGAVVHFVVRYARSKGKKTNLWASGAVLVMLLIPFWDLIPTIISRQYYCSTEAGFWIYKSVEKWKDENPNVLEALDQNFHSRTFESSYGTAVRINQRFIRVFKVEGPLLFNRWRIESDIRDDKTGEIIAREVNFFTAHERPEADWSGWKFWLRSSNCDQVSHRDPGSLGQIEMQLKVNK